jgi:hypothetical protein
MKSIVQCCIGTLALLAIPGGAIAQSAAGPGAPLPPSPDPGAAAQSPPPAAVPDSATSPGPAPDPRPAPAVAPGAATAGPPPAPAVPHGPEWTSLRLLHDKGIISDAELNSALQDLDVVGAGDATTLVFSKLRTTIYGFGETTFLHDSTQSCVEICGATQIQRPGTYRYSHGRTVMSPRSSRLGLRIAAPEQHGIRVSGLLETDFLGPTTTTEQGTWTNGVLRVRQSYVKMETPVVDIVVGQTWSLFGWQSTYLVASAQPPGLPGQLFERTVQLRLSRTVKTRGGSAEFAVAANRPPQEDSSIPEGAAGVRVSFDRWTGQHTGYLSSTTIQPASLAISGDVRGFRIPEFSANPHTGHVRVGGGIAIDGYLPIIPATKQSRDNALSVIGELAVGNGTSDMYTSLGAAGTANAALPGTTTAASTATDPGLAVVDAAGHIELVKWTSYITGLEFYPAGTGGRLGLFANYGHMQSANARRLGTAAAGTEAQQAAARAKIRDHEDFYEAGLLVDPTPMTRIGASSSLYDDTYADGKAAKNYSLLMSCWLFF